MHYIISRLPETGYDLGTTLSLTDARCVSSRTLYLGHCINPLEHSAVSVLGVLEDIWNQKAYVRIHIGCL